MNAMFATLLAILPYFVHAIYQAIQQELKKDYVLLLRLDGISNWELLKSTILPNISAIYTQEIARAFVVAILDITALSFISLGAQRPMPEWGAMIKDSLELDLSCALDCVITWFCYYFYHFIKHYFY